MTTLLKRLDTHFAACTAAAAGAALLGGAQSANAAVVYSGVVNIPIPNTFAGVYLNIATGLTTATGGTNVGMDFNPYQGGANMWQGPAPALPAQPNRAVGTGLVADNLAAGTPISGASSLVTSTYPTMGNFTVGQAGIFGLRFWHEGAAANRFAWVRIIKGANPSTPGTIVDYAYEDTGAAINAGQGAAPVNPCTQPLPACAADVAPVGGNLIVNVDDLLAVINTWGQVQTPAGTGPRPQGDAAPLPNGNCLVNVDDLLAVINAWGNCPVPSGRCCAPSGACSIQTAANCATAGGNYGGNGTTCVAFTCPVLPANDNCAGAITVLNGQTNIDNTTATDSTGIPGGVCIAGGAVNVKKDLWYSYTASCTGRLSVDLCATGGTVTDTTLQIFTGACASLAEVACDDDGCGNATDADFLSSITNFNVTTGQQFRIRVGTWAASPAGAMVLTIACETASNDFCVDATAIASLPATITGDLTGTTPDSGPICNGVTPGTGRWFTVTGNGNSLTASICDSPFGLWDGALSIYCGNDCDSLTCVVASAADQCGGAGLHPNAVTWCSAAGQTYWILVHSVGGDFNSGGQFELDVTSGAICANPLPCGPPPPPAFDECAGAIPLTCGQTHTVTAAEFAVLTFNATDPAHPCIAGAFTLDKSYWYTFTTGAAQTNLRLSFCSTNAAFDTLVTVFSGACGGPFTAVACDDDSCVVAPAFGPSVVCAAVTPNTTYKILVSHYSPDQPGDYTVVVDCVTPCAPPPSCGACVGTAEPEPCLVDGNTDTVNGGCNSAPPVFGTVALNQTICGLNSTYVTPAGTLRDTDWYAFVVPTSGTYTITVCAEHSVDVGFVTNTAGNITSCGAGQAFVAPGGVIVPANVQTTVQRTLVGGQTVALFVANGTGSTLNPCAGGTNDYRIRITTP